LIIKDKLNQVKMSEQFASAFGGAGLVLSLAMAIFFSFLIRSDQETIIHYFYY